MTDLAAALQQGRATGDPALCLRIVHTLLAVTHDQALATESAALTAHILESLPNSPLRQAFDSSEPVQKLEARTSG
jgi:hypothetical protein